MKVIVGLGNPGREYGKTRHNVGFWVVDRLANQLGIEWKDSKFKGLIGEGRVGQEKIILVKPLTYMNLSGECVSPLLHFYKIEPKEDLLVVFDDMDLPCGKIRLREKGSSGGHNGMKSIIAHLNTEQFKRIKIGIERPQPGRKVPDYVLSLFSKEQEEDVLIAVDRAVAAVKDWLDSPFPNVMNRHNQ
ncbi:MAG TPA: aminoacyl-tRNA hydrolase [Paenibacillaceae bacterium]|nr:aminoacyl-tRNA hydrolase [Paenibacillaceae bacterium]